MYLPTTHVRAFLDDGYPFLVTHDDSVAEADRVASCMATDATEALFDAIDAERYDVLSYMWLNHVPIGMDALHRAVQRNCAGLVQFLLSIVGRRLIDSPEVSADTSSHLGEVHAHDILYTAIENGSTDIVRILLDTDATLLHWDHDLALRLAARNNQTALVRFLLQHGANVRAGNYQPVKHAYVHHNFPLVLLLSRYNTDVQVQSERRVRNQSPIGKRWRDGGGLGNTGSDEMGIGRKRVCLDKPIQDGTRTDGTRQLVGPQQAIIPTPR